MMQIIDEGFEECTVRLRIFTFVLGLGDLGFQGLWGLSVQGFENPGSSDLWLPSV